MAAGSGTSKKSSKKKKDGGKPAGTAGKGQVSTAAKPKPSSSCAIWFELKDRSAVTISARLTNSSNTATSLFRLTDISDRGKPQLIGVTATQSDRAVFVVPSSHLPTAKSARCSLVLDLLPVAPPADNTTISLWGKAEQSGNPLSAYDENGQQLQVTTDGAMICNPSVATPCHCGVFLVVE